MNRRQFLTTLAALPLAGVLPKIAPAVVPVTVLDQTIRPFVPSWVTRESIRAFRNSLQFAAAINREYSKEFAVGDTVRVRLPFRLTVSRRLTLDEIRGYGPASRLPL